jgi:hypothetical protein
MSECSLLSKEAYQNAPALLFNEFHATIDGAAILGIVGGQRRIRTVPVRLEPVGRDTVLGDEQLHHGVSGFARRGIQIPNHLRPARGLRKLYSI